MNREVTITGMEVKTHVGSNLLISAAELTGTTKNDEDDFIKDETQTVKAILEPVSTVDGKKFFYTLDARADGSKDKATSVVAYTEYPRAAESGESTTGYADTFSKDYKLNSTQANDLISGETGAKPYVDYVFQLKATNEESDPKDIIITQMDLTYTGQTDTNKAFRAAVFAEEYNGTAFTNDAGTLKAIYAPANAVNFEAGKAVKTATTLDTVTYGSSSIATVGAGAIKYYKVVVRLYIEGEDTTCYTDLFKTLTDKWNLDLTLELDDGSTAVTNLNLLTTAP